MTCGWDSIIHNFSRGSYIVLLWSHFCPVGEQVLAALVWTHSSEPQYLKKLLTKIAWWEVSHQLDTWMHLCSGVIWLCPLMLEFACGWGWKWFSWHHLHSYLLCHPDCLLSVQSFKYACLSCTHNYCMSVCPEKGTLPLLLFHFLLFFYGVVICVKCNLSQM